ncbi:hypothetical protein RJ640_029746 [Escallonia rubra]|uniref:TF-B3 domain-containing protein n=1 Tax=Escallonia rubra TaxID=112253 RepID=A0AA88R0C1_9ASTE|nr:hypothetical protein RJ640_029746 [Escallonia rubra]
MRKEDQEQFCPYQLNHNPDYFSKKNRDANARIPLGFLKHMSDETSGSASLMGPSGKTWEVNLMKNNESLFFNKGWSAFVKDHFAEL